MVTELVRLGTPAAVALLLTASSLAAQASASDTSAIMAIAVGPEVVQAMIGG